MSYLLVILLLGLLILIHELGHFLAARWVGIPVERFSIGFGPRLWGFRRGETDYWLSAVPLGGYVLPRIGDEQQWFRVPLARRLAFSLGGPLANVALAVPLFAVLALVRGDVTVQAVLVGPFARTGEMLAQIVAALATVFQRPDSLTGVLGMVGAGGEYVGLDLARAIRFTILISLNLAVFNLLPLPPLDGGKIVFDVLERLLPRARRAYVPLMVSGWLAMLGLMLYTTVLDVARYWA